MRLGIELVTTLPDAIVASSALHSSLRRPRSERRLSTFEDIRAVCTAFFSQHISPSSHLILLGEVMESARTNDTFLKHTGGSDDSVPTSGFREFFERQNEGDSDIDRKFRVEEISVVHAVVDVSTTDYQLFSVRVGEVNADDVRADFDFISTGIRFQGVIVFGVPLPAFKLDGFGDFRESATSNSNVSIDILEAVDGSFSDSGKHHIDCFDFSSRRYRGKESSRHEKPSNIV
jgi:hypothetical protein